MKKSVEENVYIVNPTAIAPEQISDWLLGLGTIPIIADQTEQTPQTYYIEIEITKGISATFPPPWNGKLKIEYDIIRPVA